MSDNTGGQSPSKQKWFKKRFFKVPLWLWVVAGFLLTGIFENGSSNSEEHSEPKLEVTSTATIKSATSTVVENYRISVEYQNLTTDCSVP